MGQTSSRKMAGCFPVCRTSLAEPRAENIIELSSINYYIFITIPVCAAIGKASGTWSLFAPSAIELITENTCELN